MAYLLTFAFFVLLVSAAQPPWTAEPVIQLPPEINTSAPSNPSHQIYSSLNATAANEHMRVECAGPSYGYNLNLVDCEDAKSYIAFDSRQFTFAQRHTPEFVKDGMFPLPYRLMGDRGLCYIQILLVEGQKIGHASLGHAQMAASAIISRCVANENSQGGIAYNIGGDNNLAIAVGAYDLAVQCRGQFRPWTSCRDVLEDIPATKEQIIFGPQSDAAADVILPQAVLSDDERCLTRIFTVSGSDTASWYQLWEAVTAIFAVCVRHRQGGGARGLGDHGRLFINMVHNMDLLGNASHLTANES